MFSRALHSELKIDLKSFYLHRGSQSFVDNRDYVLNLIADA